MVRRSWSQSVWNGPVVLMAGLGAAFAVWMAWIGEPAGHVAMVLGLGFALPFLVPAVMTLACLGSNDGRLARMQRALGTLATGVLCVVLLQVPGFMAAMAVQPWRLADAKLWCEHLASDLEQWRDDHGHYPADIQGSELVAGALKDFHYRRKEDGTFEIDLLTGFGSGMTYRSRDKRWDHWD